MKVGKAFRTHANHCTACGHLLDAVSGVHPKAPPRKPTPGSITVCIECGHVMIFDKDLKLRNPQGDEFRDIAGDPRLLAVQKRLAEIRLIVEKRKQELKAEEQKET